MKKYITWISFVLVFFALWKTQAQNLKSVTKFSLTGFNGFSYSLWDSATFYKNGKLIDWPFTGGFNSSQFFHCKLNEDNIPDLVIFDRDGNTLTTFINTGKNELLPFRHAPEYVTNFPAMYNWIHVYDFNCDGVDDLFTSEYDYISSYTGIMKNNQLKFSNNSIKLKADSLPVFCPSSDIPAFADIDFDGDMDILSFDQFGTRVVYYKNLSMDNFGTCDTLLFSSPVCWGNFSEDFSTNNVNLNDSCSGGRWAKNGIVENNLHAGSTLLALDYDGDNDNDLLVGDISFYYLNLLTNGGTNNYANITEQNPTFPTSSDKVNIRIFPASYLIDIDNDNIKDLIAAPNAPPASANINQIFTYKNTSLTTSYSLQYLSDTLWSGKTIDVGTGAMPVFIDLDKDGLKDLLIGNQFYTYNNGKQTGQLMYFRNTGTLSSPAFTMDTDDYLSASSFGLFGLSPAFGDMDNDGDSDLLLGDLEGHVHLFLDTAEVNSPANFALKQFNYKNIDAGNSAIPQLFDLNEDGKLDIIIGERGGRIKYYENIGTLTEPDFSDTPTSSFLGKVDVMKQCCTGYCAPLFTKSEGKIILLAGSENGWIYEYDDIANNLNGNFLLIDSVKIPGHRIFLSMGDITNDNSSEMVIGNFGGGIFMYKLSSATSIKENVYYQNNFLFYQSGNDLNIEIFKHLSDLPYEITIYNSSGTSVKQLSVFPFNNRYKIPIGEISAGFYFIVLRNRGGVVVGKWVKM